ncbi:MAG: MBOAT family protein [Planctomycetaceae bacterium]
MLATVFNMPAWGVMWLLAVGIYVGCKAAAWSVAPRPVSWQRRATFLFAWPGMDGRAFATGTCKHQPRTTEWLFAATKFLVGVMMLSWASMNAGAESLVVGWIAMIGVVFTLHFGLFHLLSCLWRSVGFAATPLMNWPVASHSLSDFWSNRWNLAFRDLTSQFLFRPLTRHVSPAMALFSSFVASGLVHELVITVPAGGGYGGPTLFFGIQAAGILLERSSIGKKWGLNRGLRGWMFATTLLLLPVPLLLPPAFVRRVILPFVAFLEMGS